MEGVGGTNAKRSERLRLGVGEVPQREDAPDLLGVLEARSA